MVIATVVLVAASTLALLQAIRCVAAMTKLHAAARALLAQINTPRPPVGHEQPWWREVNTRMDDLRAALDSEPDKLTVEGALDFEAARLMHLAGHFADAIVLAATRNLRVVEKCETCGGKAIVPDMDREPGDIRIKACPACAGTRRKA